MCQTLFEVGDSMKKMLFWGWTFETTRLRNKKRKLVCKEMLETVEVPMSNQIWETWGWEVDRGKERTWLFLGPLPYPMAALGPGRFPVLFPVHTSFDYALKAKKILIKASTEFILAIPTDEEVECWLICLNPFFCSQSMFRMFLLQQFSQYCYLMVVVFLLYSTEKGRVFWGKHLQSSVSVFP